MPHATGDWVSNLSLRANRNRPARAGQKPSPLNMVPQTVPVGGRSNVVATRRDLREGMPEYIWEEQDVYVRAVVAAPSGKVLLDGRSKAKAMSHAAAPVALEP